jgi:hypothetical protein
MKSLYELNSYRLTGPAIVKRYGSAGDDREGIFKLPSPDDGEWLRVIASSGDGWDHVSVSREDRCPTWTEMEFVKRQFFKPDETAMQLHVPSEDHISFHPFCLHLWRSLRVEIPRPPAWMVGPKDKQ